MAVPFGVNAIAFVLGAVLIARISPSVGAVVREKYPSAPGVRGFGSELVEGFRWLSHSAAMRTLPVTVLTFNVTYGAAIGVLVFYAGRDGRPPRRLPDPDDRQGVLVEPTEEGHAAWDRAVGTQAGREALIASVLSDAEKEPLHALLRRLMGAFPKEVREAAKKGKAKAAEEN